MRQLSVPEQVEQRQESHAAAGQVGQRQESHAAARQAVQGQESHSAAGQGVQGQESHSAAGQVEQRQESHSAPGQQEQKPAAPEAAMERTQCMMDLLDTEMELADLDLRTYSPLTLAYIGDAAYELAIRTLIVRQENCPVQKLHRRTSTLVKAEAQAAFLEKLLPVLTDEEQNVYRRGRNAKFHTRAKHAGEQDYRKATGFETLMGYLYLSGKTQRLLELVQIALEGVDLRQIDARNHHG